MKKAYLTLEDGTVFEGEACGADLSAVGETVFTTGMGGYIETLTDPSYYGQLVVQTFPLIGNYGMISADAEGECRVKGYIVHDLCRAPSNFRTEADLDTFLRQRGVPCLGGVDTRALTRHIRHKGVMNGMLSDTVPTDLSALKGYRITDAVKAVSTEKEAFYPADGEEKYHVILLDYGAKRNIVRSLCRRSCSVTVVPYDTTAAEILRRKPDGVMLSNGPGDPAENVGCIGEIRALLGQVPLFGICLGHQMMALAAGGKTERLLYGHRGVNQPVTAAGGARTYITSQNHGYTVVAASLPAGQVSFFNANDGSCEGIDYPALSAFSVQFHPEACAGPRDTAFLFDRFIALMEENHHAI